mmetsp:Transcript_3858/g.11832  ORF Transcript_3858/g.11832 Transcript_3858/m.11832 type:complete len:280 (+) Transcript_3858:717-1556(+)
MGRLGLRRAHPLAQAAEVVARLEAQRELGHLCADCAVVVQVQKPHGVPLELKVVLRLAVQRLAPVPHLAAVDARWARRRRHRRGRIRRELLGVVDGERPQEAQVRLDARGEALRGVVRHVVLGADAPDDGGEAREVAVVHSGKEVVLHLVVQAAREQRVRRRRHSVVRRSRQLPLVPRRLFVWVDVHVERGLYEVGDLRDDHEDGRPQDLRERDPEQRLQRRHEGKGPEEEGVEVRAPAEEVERGPGLGAVLPVVLGRRRGVLAVEQQPQRRQQRQADG